MYLHINKVNNLLIFFIIYQFECLVQSLLKQSYTVPGTAESENDLRSIAEALFESIKDKNVTINHQRKTNK